MRIYSTLRAVLLRLSLIFVPVLIATASPVTVENNVIVQRIGSTYMFVFPSQRGRFSEAPENPAGKIKIGNTVEIAYALKIIQGGKARFVSVDGSQIPKSVIDSLRVTLTTEWASQLFGFMVKDSEQPKLDIHINPSFMAEKRSKAQVQAKIARTGNLSVILEPNENGVKVLAVYLD